MKRFYDALLLFMIVLVLAVTTACQPTATEDTNTDLPGYSAMVPAAPTFIAAPAPIYAVSGNSILVQYLEIAEATIDTTNGAYQMTTVLSAPIVFEVQPQLQKSIGTEGTRCGARFADPSYQSFTV